MTSPQLSAPSGIADGLALVTTEGARPAVGRAGLDRAAELISEGRADAVAFAPGGVGDAVLAVRTSTLLVRADILGQLPGSLLADVAGAGRSADASTALVDVQWRLNLRGFRVVARDGALPPDAALTTLGGRRRRLSGTLTMLHTNLGDDLRGPVLAAAQAFLVSSSLAATDTTRLDLQRSPGGDDVADLSVPALGLVGPYAVDQSLDDLERTTRTRERVQFNRRVPDQTLAPLLSAALPGLLGASTPSERDTLTALMRLVGADTLLTAPLRVLVVAPDDGPARELALALAGRVGTQVTVRVVAAESGTVSQDGVTVAGPVHEHTDWADAIALVGTTLDDAPGAAGAHVPLCADLTTLDIGAWLRTGPRTRYRATALADLAKRADLVLVADQLQHDMLLGTLAGMGRINAQVYDLDPTLNSLVTLDATGDALAGFCTAPMRAADSILPPRRLPTSTVALAVRYLRQGGIGFLAGKVAARVRGRLRRQETSR